MTIPTAVVINEVIVRPADVAVGSVSTVVTANCAIVATFHCADYFVILAVPATEVIDEVIACSAVIAKLSRCASLARRWTLIAYVGSWVIEIRVMA